MCSSDFLFKCEYKRSKLVITNDYNVCSHDHGYLPHTYYYATKVLQFVRLVINTRVKERVYSIFKNIHIMFMQRDAKNNVYPWCFTCHPDAAKQLYCRLLTA